MIPPQFYLWLPTGAAIVAICGAGAAIAAIFGRRPNNEVRPIGLGRAYLLGLAVLALVLHVPLALFGRITHVEFGLTMVLCVALTVWFVWRHFPPTEWWPAVQRGWMNALTFRVRLLAFILFFVAFIFSVATPLTTYDARSAFALKARILYDTGDIRSEDFRDVNRVHFNAPYPLLIPLVEAEVFWVQGSYDDFALRLIFLMFVASLASVVVSELRRFESPTTAAVWGLALLATPMIITAYEGGGMSGSADVPVACFITAAVIELAAWFRSRDTRDAVLAAILLGAASTTKPEGMIWTGMIGLAVLATLVFRRAKFARADFKAAAIAAACLLLAVGLSFAARRGVTPSPYYRDYGQALRWEWLTQIWGRPLAVVKYAGQEYAWIGHWNFVWPALVLGLCLKRKSAVPADIWFTRAAMLLIAAAVFGIFVITPYHVQFQLRTAFGRLSLQFLPLGFVLLAEHLAATGWVAEAVRNWRAAWASTMSAYAARMAEEEAAASREAEVIRLPARSEESVAA